MTNNGWRKPTPGLAAAEKHAQAGEPLAIPKTRAIVALKKVAVALGLKAPDMLLLDTLAAVTQPQDWDRGNRPIVWPSNHFLTEQVGFSLSALRRHIRRLCEAGVIAMKDSPNGKRWGKRDDDGNIIEAYGFDLSPLSARTEEFEFLHARIVEERQFCRSLRNTITVTRRIVRAKIEKAIEADLKGPWRELQRDFTRLLQLLPTRSTGLDKLMNIVDWFKEFGDRVESAFHDAFDWPDESDAKDEKTYHDAKVHSKMTPTGTSVDTHILTTNKPHLVSSNSFEKRTVENLEKKSLSANHEDDGAGDNRNIDWNISSESPGSLVDIPMLMMTCPQFAELARTLNGYLRNWHDVHRVAAQIRPMTGISEDAWNVAQDKLGPSVASAAIALIYEKYSKDEIKSPGGYLRGMVEKAMAGELNLARSFYGRLNGVGTYGTG